MTKHLEHQNTKFPSQTIALAALAILGHKSAHSLPIGPVIAEPALTKVNSKLKAERCDMN